MGEGTRPFLNLEVEADMDQLAAVDNTVADERHIQVLVAVDGTAELRWWTSHLQTGYIQLEKQR